MLDNYKNCTLCPRNCGVNRLKGEVGFCRETAVLRAGAALKHYGEEPPLVGTSGSGTIFVSGCNLGCVFCQNWQISQGEGTDPTLGSVPIGRKVSPDEFAKICMDLQEKGAININIVTGSHMIPSIIEGIKKYREVCHGVRHPLPVLWNSSGYESAEALELLKDYIDIYLPDLKTLDSEIAVKYFNAPDYPETAKTAILKMTEMKNGNPDKVIIRHLILPGHLESTRSVLKWFSENVKEKALLSLMTQYTPIPGRGKDMPEEYVSEKDYETVMSWLEEFDIENGFCQELVTGSDWLPDFTRTNPFSSDLSVPVWHYNKLPAANKSK